MSNDTDNTEADKAPNCLHPRQTYDLIGHEAAEQRFLKAFDTGHLHHAWMITGAPGTGKATLAWRMARKILGGHTLIQGGMDIPKTDPVAQRLESLGHGDFFLMRRPYDVKTKKLRAEIPVASAREMRDFFNQKPSEGGWRVCIIDSMDEMNRNTENAILKTLEEPPDRVVIILVVNMPGRLLPTIHSRCVRLALHDVNPRSIESWLRARKPDMAEDILKASIHLSNGAPGRALIFAENADTVLKPLSRYLASLSGQNSKLDQDLANMLSLRGHEASRKLFWDSLLSVLHAQAVYLGSGQWNGAFKPLPAHKTLDRWLNLWTRLEHLREREGALNMDKKTVMYEALSSIRAA